MFSLDYINTFSEFSTFHHPDKEKIINFIQLVYNKNSPFIVKFPDLQKRKTECLISADLSPKFDLEDPGYQHLVDIYLSRIQNSNEFETLISIQEALWEANMILRTPVGPLDEDKKMRTLDTKAKMVGHIQKYTEKIAELTKIIFMDDKKATELNEKRRRITPESIASQKQNIDHD